MSEIAGPEWTDLYITENAHPVSFPTMNEKYSAYLEGGE